MKKLLCIALSIACLASVSSRPSFALPLDDPGPGPGSSFTYQGQLSEGESPIEGACDLRFSLFDQAQAGKQVGDTLEAGRTEVRSGLFAVEIDFGEASLGDAGRFLEVAARCPAGIGSYETMLPRQSLTSAPFAYLARRARESDNATGDITPASISIGGQLVVDGQGRWVGESAGLRGPQGEAGPQGEPGAPGEQGPQGEPGPRGEDGDRGDQGEPGPKGDRGDDGPMGPSGEDGAMGPSGEKGDRGEPGPAGLQGDTGPRGPQGDPGPAGPAGSLALPAELSVSSPDALLRLTNPYAEPGSGAVYGSGGAFGLQGMSSQGHGVIGSSSTGAGMYGQSAAAVGVFGLTYASSGWAAGVRGTAGGGAQTAGVSGTNEGSGAGVYAKSARGLAAHFDGNILVTKGVVVHENLAVTKNVVVGGTLSKSAGSFKIDHPLDPANKYLYHSFVESPDMKNIYDGLVTLDADGGAIVELEDWFEALNREYRYQLTAIGRPAPGLYVAQEVADGRFAIAGGEPDMRVSWQVTGIRDDAYARAHPIPVEEAKSDEERGTYLHPELFEPMSVQTTSDDSTTGLRLYSDTMIQTGPRAAP